MGKAKGRGDGSRGETRPRELTAVWNTRVPPRREQDTSKLQEYRQLQANVAKDYLTIDKQPEVGLEVRTVDGIAGGRAVFAGRTIPKDTYVCEYAGDFVDDAEAERRAAEYLADPATHSWYMFHFRHERKPVCVDATRPVPLNATSRLINHSKTKPLLRVQVVVARGIPRLAMFAKRDIEIGEELRFDYGDRSKAALEAHPWLGE